MTLPTLSGVLRCAAIVLAAQATAEPWTQEKLLAGYKSLHAAEGVVTCAVEQTRVIILFDGEGKAAALVAQADNKGVRRLARQIELGETQEAGSGGCLVLLRETESSAPLKRLPENSPLQAIAFLIEQNYYHPDTLLEDGRVLWVTGKRHSVDALIPTVGTGPVRIVELRADMELTDFAANVVARKFGYPQDNCSEATKAEVAANLRAHRVHYYNKARETAVIDLGKRMFILEGGRNVLRNAVNAGAPLAFPTIFPPTEKSVGMAEQSDAVEDKSASAEEPTVENRECSPKEALKIFIDRIRKL